MSVVIDQIEAIRKITSGKQLEFYNRLRNDARAVEIVSVKEVFSESEIRLIKALGLKKQQCFRNAHLLATLMPDRVKYVEGQITICDIVCIDHAWNRVGDKYVDITSELIPNNRIDASEYVAFGEYDSEIIDKVTKSTGYYGDIYRLVYMGKL